MKLSLFGKTRRQILIDQESPSTSTAAKNMQRRRSKLNVRSYKIPQCRPGCSKRTLNCSKYRSSKQKNDPKFNSIRYVYVYTGKLSDLAHFKKTKRRDNNDSDTESLYLLNYLSDLFLKHFGNKDL